MLPWAKNSDGSDIMKLDILATGLQFPEGPVVFDDGSVIFVEIKSGNLTRYWNGKTEVVVALGGGPNGAALGPDGAIYICNNGGFEWSDFGGLIIPGHEPHDYSGGRIERVNLSTGKVERLFDTVGEHGLRGPNDLVFDAEGGFYFTDHGKSHPRHRDYGGLYYVSPGATAIKELAHGYTSPNGVGLSPDGKTVMMADTMEGRLYAFDLAGPGEIIPASPFKSGRVIGSFGGWTLFDSLALEADGTVCIATLVNPGITRVNPNDGVSQLVPTDDLMTTNIAFGGTDMRDAYITLSSTGRLAKVHWDAPGLRLNFQG
jgi:gluconolactonase